MTMLKQRNFILATLLFCCAISFAASRRIDTPLHDAIKSNKTNLGDALESVNKLLEKGNIDLSLQDSQGNTALHLALIESQNLQNETLINEQKSFYYDMANNIIKAITQKYPQKLPTHKFWHRFFRRKFMTSGQALSIKNSSGETPLDLAAKFGDPYIVNTLREHGAERNQKAKLSDKKVVIKIEDSEQDLALLDAADKGDLEALKNALNQGASVLAEDNNGVTALHIAAQLHNLEMIQTIFDAAQNKEELFLAVDKHNLNTVLHYAIFYNYQKSPEEVSAVIKKLIELGADPKAINKQGQTPLDLVKSMYDRGSNQQKLQYQATIDVLQELEN